MMRLLRLRMMLQKEQPILILVSSYLFYFNFLVSV